MKTCTVSTLLLCSLASSALCTRLRAGTAEGTAESWLSDHVAPQQDELGELKDANPEAYALVKALLTKRSLGLLDPKHPTASFQAPAKHDDAPSGAAAYEAMMTPKDQEVLQQHEDQQAEVPAEAPKPHITNMFAWRPDSSAASDDQMVQNVLGAAAKLAPAAQSSAVETQGSALGADANLFADEQATAKPAAPVQAATIAVPEPKVAPAQESAPAQAALSSADDASATQAAPAAVAPQPSSDNSYLKGLDLNGMTSAAAQKPVEQSQGADLSADAKLFDNSDSAEAAPTEAPKAKPTATPAAAAKADALSSWLGVTQSVKKSAPKQVAPKTEESSNPYMVDWSN